MPGLPNSFTFVTQITVGGAGGAQLNQTVTASGDQKVASEPVAGIPAAKTGTLTTRTSASVGTLTMDTGHGFITGDTISLFWSGGSRSNVTLGTVAGDSCPFSGGSGDDLPAATTAITAEVPTSEAFVLTGDNCNGLIAYGVLSGTDGDAIVELMSAVPAVLATYTISGVSPTGSWDGTGTNPLAGATVATVRYSHGQTASRTLGAQALYS